MDIQEQLVKLGKRNKSLRPHIRPVLASLREKTAMQMWSHDDLVSGLAMAAQNEGRHYQSRDAKGAVDAAAKEIQKQFLMHLRDAKRDAIREVERVWGDWDRQSSKQAAPSTHRHDPYSLDGRPREIYRPYDTNDADKIDQFRKRVLPRGEDFVVLLPNGDDVVLHHDFVEYTPPMSRRPQTYRSFDDIYQQQKHDLENYPGDTIPDGWFDSLEKDVKVILKEIQMSEYR